jgi:hypothetical protein
MGLRTMEAHVARMLAVTYLHNKLSFTHHRSKIDFTYRPI